MRSRIVRKEQLNAQKSAVFKTWFECARCNGKVDVVDRFCRWCGSAFIR